MHVLTRLTAVEAKLFIRQPATALCIFVLPLAITIGFSVLPNSDEPSSTLDGQTTSEYIAALSVGILLAILALNLLPSILADNREKGILRRLRVTPVSPRLLLTAQLTIYVASAIVASTLVVAIATLGFDVPVPGKLAAFVLAFALGVCALLGVGLFIAAVAPSGQAATGIGMSVFFPSMFLAGVYVPRDQLPHALQKVCDVTPLGATIQSLRETWMGHGPGALHLVIMAAYAVVATAAAARFFRWE